MLLVNYLLLALLMTKKFLSRTIECSNLGEFSDSDLSFRSFKLLSEVEVRAEINATYKIEQIHSQSQSRELIHIRPIMRTNSNASWNGEIDFLIDWESPICLRLSSGLTSAKERCSICGQGEPEHFLGLDLMPNTYTENNLVGPARLLFHVWLSRDSLQLLPGKRMVRNFACSKYVLKMDDGLELGAYFPDSGSSFPLRVVLSKNMRSTFIEYFSFEPLQMVEGNLLSHPQVDFDPLILRPMSGCSSLLNWSENILGTPRTNDFSFEAQIITSQNSYGHTMQQNVLEYKIKVVYSNELKLMRVDLDGKSDATNSSKVSTIQIFDFNTNRHLHALNGQQDDEGGNHDLVRNNNWCSLFSIGSRAAKISGLSDSEKVLLGSEEPVEYVYLGRAVVRGEEVKVFESTNQQLEPPIWLDQTIQYIDQNGSRKVRTAFNLEPSSYSGETHLKMLVFVGAAGASVLRIELHLMDPVHNFVLEQYNIDLSNFHWDSAWRDLLWSGLHPDNSRTGAQKDYKTIHLMLESSKNSSQLDIFANLTNHQRNSVILNGLRNHIDTLMVSDLYNKLIFRDDQPVEWPDMQGREILLMISFKWSKLSVKPIDLVFLFRARELDDSNYLVQSLTMITLSQCYFFASHIDGEIFFAYDRANKSCYIQAEGTEPFFEANNDGEIEVFRTRMVPSRQDLLQSEEPLSQLSSDDETQISIKNTGLGGPVTFRLVNIQVREEKITRDRSTGAKSIDGYKLVTGARKKLLENDGWLSRTTCHMACLWNTRCESFSVCIEGFRMSCELIESRLDVDKINEKIGSFASVKMGQIIEVYDEWQGDGSPISVERRSNCQIGVNNYLDLFSTKREILNSKEHMMVLPASRMEQCATICAQKNIETISASTAHFANSDQRLWPEHHPPSFWNASQKRQSDVRGPNLCQTVHFVSQMLLQTQPIGFIERLMRAAYDTVERVKSNKNFKIFGDDDLGYCVVPSNAGEVDNVLDLRDVELSVESADFNFITMFEQINGVGLKESHFGTGKATTMEELLGKYSSEGLHSSSVIEEKEQLLRLKAEKNFQVVTQDDEISCAWTCVRQSAPFWPACRSFDIVIQQDPSREKKFRKICVLNSMTLRDIMLKEGGEKSGLINYASSPGQYRCKHFEPRFGYATEPSTAETEGDNPSLSMKINLTDLNIKNLISIISRSMYIVALLCGLYLGQTIAKYRLRQHLQRLVRRSVVVNSTVRRTTPRSIQNLPKILMDESSI